MNEERGYVFICTSFGEKGRERAEQVAAFLELFGLRCVIGDTFGGGEVSRGVRERIQAAWFVIALFSRNEKISDDTWRASEWVIQETAVAKAYDKEAIILKEDQVVFNGGILGDVEYLTFNAGHFTDVFIPLGRQLRALLNRQRLTTGIKKLPVRTYVSDEPLQNECEHEVRLLIIELRHLAKQQRFEEALELAVKATRADPKYWRAWTSLGALLVQLGQVDEGDEVFVRVLKDFADNQKGVAAASHNRAWVRELKSGTSPAESAVSEEAPLYEKALNLDGSRVNTRACLYICWLILGESKKADRLLADSLHHEGFLDALRFELDTRGEKAHKALHELPSWLRNLLYPARPGAADGDGQTF